MKVLNWPLDKAGDLILATPGLGDAIKLSIQGLTGVCNDVAQWSVQSEVIYAEFRKAGHFGINQPADVFGIELEHVDRVVAWLDAKYKGNNIFDSPMPSGQYKAPRKCSPASAAKPSHRGQDQLRCGAHDAGE